MPVGISSPARNLFLLGSTGEQTVTNFFKAVDLSASSDGVFLPEAIKYRYGDDSYTIGGTASDPQSKRFGWIENRTYNPETAASTQVWDDRIESSVPAQSVFLRSIIFDQVGRIIAVGHGGGTCWIRRYSSAGVLDWQASTFTGEARYLGVAHDGLAYYVCGHTGPGDDGSAIAYVEKFDDQGNPIWGKAAFFEYDDTLLESIAIADDGNILAVGRIDDNDGQKGFMVKLDSQTGDVLWDKTITSPKKFNQFLSLKESVGLEKIYADGNGQFYVVGRVLSTRSGSVSSRGILIKFDTEGNIIWQKETPLDATKSIEFFDVSAETDTEQVIVLGRYYDGTANDEMGILSKYTKNGTLLWRRTIKSSRESSDKFSTAINPPVLDADSSFYYLLFRDESIATLSGEPDRYTFGKVSTSGNGLGDFQYDDSTGETIDYEIVNIDSNVGILQDGSVTNSVSDLRSTPYSAENIVFDDYATNIAGKKRKISEGFQSFMYSGSPAVRPQDFCEDFRAFSSDLPSQPRQNYIGDSDNITPDVTSTTDYGNKWRRQSTAVNVTANAIANPLGVGDTAELYNLTATSGRRIEYGGPVLVAGQKYTYSWWMKAVTTDAQWDFQAYNISTSNNSIHFADRQGNILEDISVGTTTYNPKDTEWHRVCWTFTAGSSATVAMGGYNSNSQTGDLWYLYGAQMVDGTLPGVYYQTGDPQPNEFETLPTTDGQFYRENDYWQFDGNGSNDFIQLPHDEKLHSTEFTFEWWMYNNSVANNTATAFFTKRTNNEDGYMIFTQSNQILHFDFGTPTIGSHRWNTGFNCGGGNLGRWHHCVLTRSDAGRELYINGELFSNTTDAGVHIPNIQDLFVGTDSENPRRYEVNGKIGEFRIYNRVLTATQVFQNYNASKFTYKSELPNTTPRLNIDPIVMGSNMIMNFDFGNGHCIEKSSEINASFTETILDDASTNGAAFGDGQSVAVGYGKVVVGARGEDCTIPGYTYTAGGKAYIYNATTGALEATLIASDISGNDWNFGNAVAICGCSGKIAVTSNSALYLYDADGTNEIIIDSNSTLPISPPGGNTFGNGLAISGNRVWVSDNNVPQGSSYSGTVYCFNTETGAFLYELRPKDIFGNFSAYGLRIAAGGGKLAIGADNINHPVTGRSNTGKVYLYNVDGTNEKIIEPDVLTTGALFGTGGLVIDHGMLVVGASRQQRVENPLELGSGEVYVFDLKGKLKFSIRPTDDPADEDTDAMGFGDSVAVSSDRLIVGAQYYALNIGGVMGRSYLFTHAGRELDRWFGSGLNGDNSAFGSSMAASGGTLAIGAGSGSPDSSGRVYLYPLTGSPSGTITSLTSGATKDTYDLGFTGTVSGPVWNPAGYFEFGQSDSSGITGDFDYNDGSYSDITVEAWIYGNNWNVNGNTYNAILNRSDGTNHIFSTFILSSGEMAGWWFDVNGNIINNDSSASGDPALVLSTGQWNHCVWVYNDGAGMEYYLNNSAASVYSNSALRRKDPSNQSFTIGKWNQNQYELDGRIGELRFYDRKLFASEISQNFNATRTKYGV